MEVVDLVQVPENGVGSRSSLRQVRDGQLVPVVPEDLFDVVDVPALGHDQLGENVFAPDLQSVGRRVGLVGTAAHRDRELLVGSKMKMKIVESFPLYLLSL